VPESAAGARRTVDRRPSVIVTVIRREHHPVAVAQCIVTGVTRVPGHLQPVVVDLGQYSERAVLGNVPVVGVATRLQVEPQLEAVVRRQLTEQFVAEPVVASRPTLNFAHERRKKLDPSTFCWTSKGTHLATKHVICVSKLQLCLYLAAVISLSFFSACTFYYS